MKIYFLSSKPCALKIDGEFAGKTDGFERFLDLHIRDRHFIEFIPQGDFLSTNFFLTEDILFSPPKGVKLGHAPYVLIIYADKFHQKEHTFQLAAQKNNTAVYADGEGYQLFFHGKIFPLIGNFDDCSIEEFSTFVLIKGRHHVCVLALDELIYNGKFSDLTYDKQRNILMITREYEDFFARTETLIYDCNIHPQLVRREYSKEKHTPPNGMITACFLQSLSGDQPCLDLLSNDLQNIDFKGFFGGFIKVLPVGIEHVALVYESSTKGVYTLKFFSGIVSDGKITNITRDG